MKRASAEFPTSKKMRRYGPQYATSSYYYPAKSGGTKPHPDIVGRYKSMIPRTPASLMGGSNEIKALTTSHVSAAPGGVALNCNSTGSIIPLNLIQAGSSFYNRVGRKVSLKSIEIDLNINPISAARSSVMDQLRVMIIYDRQTNGTLPSISDILQDTDQAGTNTTNSYSKINLNNRDRFTVIRDIRMNLPAITNTAAGVPTDVFPTVFHNSMSDWGEGNRISEYVKLKGLSVQFRADSNPAVIGDIATGGLYLITFATNGAGTEGFIVAGWNARLRYWD